MRFGIRTLSLTIVVILTALLSGSPALANHDIFDTDLHPCSIAPAPPSMSTPGNATADATYECPNAHRHMTVQVWIEVFVPTGGGYRTVVSDTNSSGTTPTPFFTHTVTGRVCIPGATQMKTKATGWWIDSHGNERGTRNDESRPVPLLCAANS